MFWRLKVLGHFGSRHFCDLSVLGLELIDISDRQAVDLAGGFTD